MHPAPSIIIFTALSGLGFGLMAWMGIGQPTVGGWVAVIFALAALGLASIGLLASLFHLGNPQRFAHALTQWRSSWLSREGILSIVTMGLFTIYMALWAFDDNRVELLGKIVTLSSLLTIFATSMIYAQMKSVPRWNSPFTPVLFGLYAFSGGALLASLMQVASLFLTMLAVMQTVAWLQGDGAFRRAGSTLATATGLGHLGKLRLLEPPHTGSNYLMREMIHVVGRKHMLKLRVIALILTGILPAFLIQILQIGHGLAVVLLLMHLAGLFTARWLFFAEAEHVVGLYYDKR